MRYWQGSSTCKTFSLSVRIFLRRPCKKKWRSGSLGKKFIFEKKMSICGKIYSINQGSGFWLTISVLNRHGLQNILNLLRLFFFFNIWMSGSVPDWNSRREIFFLTLFSESSCWLRCFSYFASLGDFKIANSLFQISLVSSLSWPEKNGKGVNAQHRFYIFIFIFLFFFIQEYKKW